jgi:hypothetical protein
MDGACSTLGEVRNAYKDLVGKPEGKWPLVRLRGRCEDNIKIVSFLWSPYVNYHVWKSSSLVSVLSQMKQVHPPPPCYSDIYVNIILSVKDLQVVLSLKVSWPKFCTRMDAVCANVGIRTTETLRFGSRSAVYGSGPSFWLPGQIIRYRHSTVSL